MHETQVFVVPAEKQKLFTQSVLRRQFFVSAHAGQAAAPLYPVPPQSLSVSLPF